LNEGIIARNGQKIRGNLPLIVFTEKYVWAGAKV